MQPSTTMMKIVTFLSIRYSMSFIILRNHEETLKPSSLPSVTKATFGELIFKVLEQFIYFCNGCLKERQRKLNL